METATKRKMKVIGQFTLRTGKVMVSDPYYVVGTWCQKIVKNVLPGKWVGLTLLSDEGDWGTRVAEMIAVNKSFKKELKNMSFRRVKADIGVDSGQCGFIELSDYKDYETNQNWYDRICNLTYDATGKDRDRRAGILDGSGVVSSSGYGDGGYELFVAKDENKKIIAMKVVFIS